MSAMTMDNSLRVNYTIDEILIKVNEFGKFQKLLCLMIFLLLIPASLHPILMYFGTLTPDWKCVSNSTSCKWNGTFSGDEEIRCHLNRTEWQYTEEKGFSLVTEFDLHCEQKWVVFLVESIYFVGWGSGSYVIGWLADRYGRKTFMYPSLVIVVTFAVITPFVPNIYLIVLIRFVIGFFYPGVITQGFVLLSELVGNKYRPLATGCFMLSFPTCWIFLTYLAEWLKNWKHMSFASASPVVIGLCFYKFIPESTRWLHSMGRTDEAMEIFYRIARFNKRELSETVTISKTESNQSKKSLKDLLRINKTAIRFVVLVVLWFFTAMGFYGIQLAANDLEGSVYTDFIYLCLAEYPSMFMSVPLCTKIGRKKTSLLPLCTGGAACIAIGMIPEKNKFKAIRVTLGITGKFVMNIVFNGIYTWSAEIFSTDVRAEAIGVFDLSSCIGSALSPWVAKGLRTFGVWIPFTVMGITCLISCALGILLPETQHMAMKESLDEEKERSKVEIEM